MAFSLSTAIVYSGCLAITKLSIIAAWYKERHFYNMNLDIDFGVRYDCDNYLLSDLG